MSALEAKKIGTVNGLDVDALHDVIDEVKKDPSKGIVEFKVKTADYVIYRILTPDEAANASKK